MNPVHELKKRLDEQGLWRQSLSLQRNEFLFCKGKAATDIYYINSGSLRLYIVEDDREQIIRFGYKGSLIAALDSYISGSPTELYAQAIKKTELQVISKQTFLDFIESTSDNQRLWHMLLEQLVYQQLEREIDVLTLSPVERYRRVLKRSPQLFQEIPNRHIASYLRMSPETLSRLKKS